MPKTAPTLFPFPPFPPFPPGGRWTVLRESHGPASLSRPRPASDASLPCRNESTGPPAAAAAGALQQVHWRPAPGWSCGLVALGWRPARTALRRANGVDGSLWGALCPRDAVRRPPVAGGLLHGRGPRPWPRKLPWRPGAAVAGCGPPGGAPVTSWLAAGIAGDVPGTFGATAAAGAENPAALARDSLWRPLPAFGGAGASRGAQDATGADHGASAGGPGWSHVARMAPPAAWTALGRLTAPGPDRWLLGAGRRGHGRYRGRAGWGGAPWAAGAGYGPTSGDPGAVGAAGGSCVGLGSDATNPALGTHGAPGSGPPGPLLWALVGHGGGLPRRGQAPSGPPLRATRRTLPSEPTGPPPVSARRTLPSEPTGPGGPEASGSGRRGCCTAGAPSVLFGRLNDLSASRRPPPRPLRPQPPGGRDRGHGPTFTAPPRPREAEDSLWLLSRDHETRQRHPRRDWGHDPGEGGLLPNGPFLITISASIFPRSFSHPACPLPRPLPSQ